MKEYFKDITTLEELRKQYKNLLKEYHPDNVNGSEEITKAINLQYELLFIELKNSNYKEKESETSYNNMKYDFTEDTKLREILNNIITLTGINIEIIGSWIWVDGNTYQHKAYLNDMGFKWAGEKKKWYFHTEAFRKKSKKKLTIEEIRDYYGGMNVRTQGRQLIEA